MRYGKQKKSRLFVSIYFENGFLEERKRRDLTISFNYKDPLYEKCKGLGSTKIKEIIGIHSYKALIEEAKKEDRNLSNFIKHILKKKLGINE